VRTFEKGRFEIHSVAPMTVLHIMGSEGYAK
jgi:hypothetical protein